MRILILGGSGQIGRILCRDMVARGWNVTILSRSGKDGSSGVEVIRWDGETLGSWCDAVDRSDVVINLCGRTVNCRYNESNRRSIVDSRVRSTEAIVKAIAGSVTPPALLLQSSTATIYSHRFDAANDDIDGNMGGDEDNVPDTWRFSIEVAKRWEAAATSIPLPSTRVVLMRSAMTMSPDPGGVFDVLLRLVRLGLGGTNGDGRQFVSWIHDEDFVASVHWLIDHPDLDGPINLCSPNPVENREFMRTLRGAWGARLGLPASRWMLEIGAFFLRTETELILKSRRVIPRRLQESGFEFQFPQWSDAAADLSARYRNENRRTTDEVVSR